MSQTKKPSLNDYEKIEDFSFVCIELQKTLAILNNHLEVLKRSGDVDELRVLNNQLKGFVLDSIASYKCKLSEDEDKE